MNYREWHVGMRVVCVDAGGWEPKLRRGSIYTISALGFFAEVFYIGLEETPHPKGLDLHWKAQRFRPVQTRKTDISIFTAMLTDTKQKVSA